MWKVGETASGKVLVEMTEEEWRLLSSGGSSQERLDMALEVYFKIVRDAIGEERGARLN